MIENTGLVAIALLLVLLNGFFVASEFAIVKMRATRVEELRKVHGLRGRILSAIHKRLDAYLSACQLGITLASLGLGWIGEPAFARLLEGPAEWLGLDDDPNAVEAAAFIFAFSLISFLHIVVGELAPKSMAIRKAEAVSLWTSVPLWLFYWVMYPFIWILNGSANVILRVFGLGGLGEHAHEAPYSREELQAILRLSRPTTERSEHAIASALRHTLELPDLDVSDLMRPMRELVGIRQEASFAQVRRVLWQHRYSRYPVLGEHNEVTGILHIKDIYLEDDGPGYSGRLLKWLHQPLRVESDCSVSVLLRTFQQGASHFSLVLDAEGQPAGFLTLEDVLEAIFGEITDEHEPLRRKQVRREPLWEKDGRMLARGDTALFRIERELGRPIKGSDDVNTLSGLLMRTLDRVPHTGDAIEHDGLRFDVVDARGPHVRWVRIASTDPARPTNPRTAG